LTLNILRVKMIAKTQESVFSKEGLIV